MNLTIPVFDPNHVFWTSDTHFCHKSIVDLTKRPFDSVEEMDETIIKNWNSIVTDDDTVFHLGDFCFGGIPAWERVRARLNGSIYLVIGNHDEKQVRTNNYRISQLFQGVNYQMKIIVDGQEILMNHYPFLAYAGTYRKPQVWQLFGHVHSKEGSNGQDYKRLQYLFPCQYDVGVDNNNFTPVSFSQLKKIMYDSQNENR